MDTIPGLKKLNTTIRRVKATFLRRRRGKYSVKISTSDTEFVKGDQAMCSLDETQPAGTVIRSKPYIATFRNITNATLTSYSGVSVKKTEYEFQIQPDTKTHGPCGEAIEHDIEDQKVSSALASWVEIIDPSHASRHERSAAEETERKSVDTNHRIRMSHAAELNPTRDSTAHLDVQLTDLPEELLLRICIHVPKDSTFAALKSTCRRFHILMKEQCVWRNHCLHICANLKLQLVRKVMLCATHSLTSLNVRGCLSVTDAFLRYVATGCPNIRHVDVGYCSLVSDIGLMAVSAQVQALRSLCVCGTRLVTSEGIGTVLAAHCATITHLDISHCIGLERNAYKLSYLPDSCTNLICLRFCWYKDFLNLIPLWEMRVSQFAASCPNLLQLDVSGSPVRDFKDAVNSITNHCKLLRKLDLSKSAVNDEGLVKIAAKLQDLESLDVSESTELSDVGLHSLSLGLHKLRYLNLSGCFRFTDDGISMMLHALPLLRDLLLRSCYQITDDSFTELRPTLKYLDISGTMISKKLLARLKQNTPSTSKFIILTEDCPFVCNDCDKDMWPEIPVSILS